MKKHAYLILVHNEPSIFETLISLLDDERNDIFVHVDKKTDITQFQKIQSHYSNLIFIQERIDVRWGDISMMQAEMNLFKGALRYASIVDGGGMTIIIYYLESTSQ